MGVVFYQLSVGLGRVFISCLWVLKIWVKDPLQAW